jgi:hypothetical protein
MLFKSLFYIIGQKGSTFKTDEENTPNLAFCYISTLHAGFSNSNWNFKLKIFNFFDIFIKKPNFYTRYKNSNK